jgi:hypothetical protein
MKKLRRFSTAFVLSAFVAIGMALTPARVEAKKPGSGGGGTPDPLICSTLLAIINYQYIDPAIRYFVVQTYLAYGCDGTLL